MRRCLLAAVLIILTTSGCVPSRPPAQPGQRVQLVRVREIPLDSLERNRPVTVVGELVRQSGDTVWLRDTPFGGERTFMARPGTRPVPRMARSVDDPWLVGDSIRGTTTRVTTRGPGMQQIRLRQREVRRWGVSGVVQDTLLLSGLFAAQVGSGPVFAGPDETLQRQVRRMRPMGPLLAGALLVTGGLVLVNNAPEPRPPPGSFLYIDPGTATASILGATLVGTGAIIALTAPLPRVGWDRIEQSDLPPVRTTVDAIRVEVEWRVPVGEGRRR
ncbi:MAG TPA: hypothetical protein VLA09_03240 [Longimicrobiales bacterium]|nr:hypothetical protein [Longimicrobiales bacterium]